MSSTDKRLKVLIPARHLVGGIRTYLKYTFKYLDATRYEFTILSVINDLEESESRFLTNDLKNIKIRVIEKEGDFEEWILLKTIFSELLDNKYDLIHSQGLTAGVLTAIVNQIFHIPHIITSHDVFRPDQFNSKIGFLKKIGISFLLKRVDILQSVSNDAQANLLEFLPALKSRINHLKVIHNGIDLEVFNKSTIKENMRAKWGIDNSTFAFGFLGRFMPQKGFDILIEAVEEFTKVNDNVAQFKIVAVNDGAFIREYKKIIHDKNLEEYFIFQGFTKDIQIVINSLDAVVIPSLWEAFSLLPMEAMILGCPIIVSNCIGLREVARNTPAIVFEMSNVKALIDVLKHFMKNSESIKYQFQRFKKRAQYQYDSIKTSDKLDNLYNEILFR